MCSYLWNVFISLDTEAGVTLVGDWSKVDLVALYFIPAHYNIFYNSDIYMLTLHIAAMKAKKHLLRTVYVEISMTV